MVNHFLSQCKYQQKVTFSLADLIVLMFSKVFSDFLCFLLVFAQIMFFFLFFRIKFWAMFCAYLQISSSTCNFVNLNRLCSLSRNLQLLSCNFSITLLALVLFLTLTVLKRATTLITQQSLLIKSLYAISPLTTI